ncbi:MAG: PilW family protein [Desulfobulbus sp.]|nr:PilW family protein [Desulfobulbus sp.]
MKRDDNTLPILSQSGFSLVELLVYMVILSVLMALITVSFTQTARQSARQSGIAETQIETGVGLELLRSDLESAGFGLPWGPDDATFPGYGEPGPLGGVGVPSALNGVDLSADSQNTADYLVIRATSVIRDPAGQRWGWLGFDASGTLRIDSLSREPLDNDWVIALRTNISAANTRSLETDVSGVFGFHANAANLEAIAPAPTINDPDGERLLLYAIADKTTAAISRPFNRIDYYIQPGGEVPSRCAPGTRTLSQRQLNQTDGNFSSPQPVVDCVADFQVVFFLDTDEDGGWDQRVNANGLAGLNAAQIRNRVKEVRCFILLHEGGEDRSYTHPTANVNVGVTDANGNLEIADDGSGPLGRQFNLAASIGPNWANYRWKVVNLTVNLKNLR